MPLFVRRLIATFALASTVCCVAPVAAAASDSDLDTRFNHDTVPALNGGIGRGSLSVDFDNLIGAPSFDVARGIAKLPDGKYLVASLVNPGANGKVGLVRLNPDGTRDTSFGSPGSLGRILRSGGAQDMDIPKRGLLGFLPRYYDGNRADSLANFYWEYTTNNDAQLLSQLVFTWQ